MRLQLPCLLVVLATHALGCGGESSDETTPVTEPVARCAPGQWQRDDGSCVAAGLPPDMPCPPGQWLDGDACIPAGVPPSGCGEGFVHDGDGGCEPILPALPCAVGSMAVVGETRCREVAPCGPHKWGDIPIEPDTEYVDAGYAGSNSDGSALKPWTSIQAGIEAAAPGAIVAIAVGSYPEDAIVSGKAVRLWGVCPRLVELAGVELVNNAAPIEVRGVAIRGNANAIAVDGTGSLLLERVWVHDNSGIGLYIVGPMSVTMRGALVERNLDAGVVAFGAEVTIEDSVVRNLNPQGLDARGVLVSPHGGTGAPTTLTITRSLIEQNQEVGVAAAGSNATIQSSVIRTTARNAQGQLGRGISLQADVLTGGRSTLMLRSSLVEWSHEDGIFVGASDATVEASVVRNTRSVAAGTFGRGINLQPHPMTGEPSTLVLARSLVERNQESGIRVSGSDAKVEASLVRDTQPNDLGLSGRGVDVQVDVTGTPSTLELRTSHVVGTHEMGVRLSGSNGVVEDCLVSDTEFGTGLIRGDLVGPGVIAAEDPGSNLTSTLLLRRSLIERSHLVGAQVQGSEMTLEQCVIRDTLADNQGMGIGVAAVAHPLTGAPALLVLRGSLVEHNRQSGVAIASSELTLDGSIVRDTLARESDGKFGDTVAVVSKVGAAHAVLRSVLLESGARAGLGVFGASVEYSETELRCHVFDLVGEIHEGHAYVVENGGGNRCGCPAADGECILESAGFEPPPSIEPLR